MRLRMKRRPCNLAGPIISRLRNQMNMSQERFVILFQRKGWDMTRETLAHIETQRRHLSDFELVFIARCLKVPVTELLPKVKLNEQVDDMIDRLEWSMT